MAEGTTLGRAYVQIMPSAEGIKGNIEKALDADVSSAGSSAGSKWASAFKTIIATAGIGAAIKAAVSEGMDLEQNLGGTAAVFGDFAKDIQNSAQNAYKNMGMSASEYMATANKMGSLFQGSGLEQQEALDLTTQAMQRAADVASVMGIDTTTAMESIAGAAKGNFTMMDNLGVAMNATTLQAYALEKGVNFDWNTASNAEKATLAMQMFMDRTSQYEGNFARESEQTLAGSLSAMQASFKNVIGNLAIGEDIMPSLQSLMDTACTFLIDNLLPTIGNILSGLPNIISTLVQGVTERLPDLIATVADIVSSFVQNFVTALPEVMEAGGELLSMLVEGILDGVPKMIDSLPKIIDGFLNFITQHLPEILKKGVELTTELANGIVQAIPQLVSKLPQIISSFVNFISQNLPQIVQAGVQLLLNLANGIIQAIPQLVAQLPQIITSITSAIAQNMPQIIQSGMDILMSLAKGILQAIPQLVSQLPQVVQAIYNGFNAAVSGVVEIGTSIVEGVWQGIQSAIGWFTSQVTNFFSGIVNKVKSALGINSPSKVFAGIGGYMAEGLGVGWNDEYNSIRKSIAKDMNFNGSVDVNGSGQRAGSREVLRGNSIGSVTINIQGAQGQDVSELADIVIDKITSLYDRKAAALA